MRHLVALFWLCALSGYAGTLSTQVQGGILSGSNFVLTCPQSGTASANCSDSSAAGTLNFSANADYGVLAATLTGQGVPGTSLGFYADMSFTDTLFINVPNVKSGSVVFTLSVIGNGTTSTEGPLVEVLQNGVGAGYFNTGSFGNINTVFSSSRIPFSSGVPFSLGVFGYVDTYAYYSSQVIPPATATLRVTLIGISVYDAGGNLVTNGATVYSDSSSYGGLVTKTGLSCQVSQIVNGPPKQLVVMMQDSAAGLQSINVTQSVNSSVPVPAFSPGTTQPVLVTATKINQSQTSDVAFVVTNTAGAQMSCDPVDFSIDLEGVMQRHVFRAIPTAEHYIRIVNGTPGVHGMAFAVNGHKFSVPDLKDGGSYLLDIGSAMFPSVPEIGAAQRISRGRIGFGNNYVAVEATGARGSSAYILIGDDSVK